MALSEINELGESVMTGSSEEAGVTKRRSKDPDGLYKRRDCWHYELIMRHSNGSRPMEAPQR